MSASTPKDTRWLRFSREGNQFFGIALRGETTAGNQDSLLAAYEHLAGNQDSIFAVFDSLTGEQVSTLKGLPGDVITLEDASFSSKGTRLALSVFHPSVPASTADANVQGGAWINNATAIELIDVQTGDTGEAF